MALFGSNGKSASVRCAMSRLKKIHDCLYNWSNFAPDLPGVYPVCVSIDQGSIDSVVKIQGT